MSQCKCDLLSHSLRTSCTNQGSLTSLLVVFWFVFWFAVVSVCCFGFALILFGMVMASLDCVLVLLQHGLLWPIFSPRWMNSNATINAKHAACKYSVWIDLAKAKRRLMKKNVRDLLQSAWSWAGQVNLLKACSAFAILRGEKNSETSSNFPARRKAPKLNVHVADYNLSQTTGEDHFLESKKLLRLRSRKWDCCSDLFDQKLAWL